MISIRQGKVHLWQLTAFIAALIIYNIVFAVGPQAILSTQANDALMVARLAREALYVSNNDGYYFVARAYALLPEVARSVTVYAIATWYIWEFFKRTRQPINLSVSLFLITAPIIMCLALFIKDTFAVLMILVTYQFISRDNDLGKAMLVVAILYCIGGLVVRPYYILIFAVLVAVVAVRVMPKMAIPVLVIATVLVIALMPQELAQQLQGSRDLYNLGKIGRDLDGYRTSFMNPLRPVDGVSFAYNYVYAIVRLNLPFLFTGLGLKELYLTICVGASFAVCVFGLRQATVGVWLPSSLYISHMLVYFLFEPDLGSYLRHLSTGFVYLVPSLATINFAVIFAKRVNVQASQRSRLGAL
jgi:hypothetical protein